MKTLISILITLSLIIPTITQAKQSYVNLYYVKYVDNYDGDTVKVNIEGVHPIIGHNISIRIRGIDTPEIRGGCLKERTLAKEAKELVKNILTNADDIVLKDIRRGKYFRIVADIYADGVNISEILLDKGLAVIYYGGTKVKDWCE